MLLGAVGAILVVVGTLCLSPDKGHADGVFFFNQIRHNRQKLENGVWKKTTQTPPGERGKELRLGLTLIAVGAILIVIDIFRPWLCRYVLN